MFSLSSLLHLRVPFSYFLLPIFLFSLSISPNITGNAVLWTFIIVHFFLYPASNAYNSYFDKDEKSIGGLKNPPPVKKGLYYLAITFDVIAVVLGALKINVLFASMLFIYGLVSKAYSHPSTRLKKYAIISWVITGVFQGLFTFVMCYAAINMFPLESCLKPEVLAAGLLTTVMLWANYPMTQVYQHDEDKKHGDRTMSMLLGIRGTFLFTGGLFVLVCVGFVIFFDRFYTVRYGGIFLISLLPVVIYFLWWLRLVWRKEDQADHKHTMWLIFISATSLNGFFIYFFLDRTNIIQAFQ
jgi:4-hydroxybenzoate polyprenyltransferase